MNPTRSQIEKVASLASLRLSEEELTAAEGDFASILGYFDRLAQVPTDDVPAMLGVQPHHNVFRDDQVQASLQPTEAVANATSAEHVELGHFFRIPKILD